MAYILIALALGPIVLYLIISSAVREGVYKALGDYDNFKRENQKEI